jgi:thiol-disulfide isomerase/thioredoxin
VQNWKIHKCDTNDCAFAYYDRMKTHLFALVALLLVWSPTTVAADDYAYFMYRVEIMTPGGPLPFMMMTDVRYDRPGKFGKSARSLMVILNGDERLDCDEQGATTEAFYEEKNRSARFIYRLHSTSSVSFPQYDSELEWHRWDGYGIDRQTMWNGVWKKRRGEEYVELPILVTRLDWEVPATDGRRFVPFPEELYSKESAADFAGRWSVDFDSSNDLAVGTFTVDTNQLASGTFLTTTGDYRYLAGRVDGNLMRLSTFDGAHAFLFHARLQDDGSIEGDFWSGNWHHETWTAVRDDDAKLPDAFKQTVIADEEALAEAVFKDLQGQPTRVLDVLGESKAEARVIEIFGTWCPNCSDAGRELVSLKEKYGDDLAIVGLAFEITEDFARSAEQVKRHHDHIGTSWPILIAGLSDKDKATATLGFLDRVRSYPTLVFLNEANEVQAVYSGFSGPATGDAYTEQRRRFEALIEGLIGE